MGRLIVKIRDRYCFWSTIVDSPVTYLYTYERFRQLYQLQFGADAMKEFDQRMNRVATTGTSSVNGTTAHDIIKGNRAGEREKRLTSAELYIKFKAVDKPKRPGGVTLAPTTKPRTT